MKPKTVFTNGCFDLLHPGHVWLLKEAKELGDYLIVGVNSDESVAGIKGPNRPIITLHYRTYMLRALECVDMVLSFNEPTPLRLIQDVQPDVLVKGPGYEREKIVGYKEVTERGGEVVILEPPKALMFDQFSTTNILKRLGGST